MKTTDTQVPSAPEPVCTALEALYQQSLLDPADASALEAHVAGCASCRARLANYQRLDHALRQHVEQLGRTPLGTRDYVHALAAGERSAPRGLAGERPFCRFPNRNGLPPIPQRGVFWVGAVAAVLVISLLATALILTRLPGPGTQPPGGPQPTRGMPSSWTVIPTHILPAEALSLAPSDPRVLYQALGNGGPDTPSTPFTLQRSDDGGLTWQNLPTPDGLTEGDEVKTFVVSPLNPQVVWVTLGVACNAVECTRSYLSQDGGQHWSRQEWPMHLAGSWAGISDLRAQEGRLYLLMLVTEGVGGLLTSTDGGTSWHFADQPLFAQGHCVTSYAPTATGATVFAVTSDTCGGTIGAFQAFSRQNRVVPTAGVTCGDTAGQLWRSDDAGAQWTLVKTLPASAVFAPDLQVVTTAGALQPRLYVDSCPASFGTPTVQVSIDGGTSWQAAPALAGTTRQSKLVGTLSNGSVVELSQFQLFAWRAGEVTWRPLAPPLNNDLSTVTLLITHQAANNTDTLWVIGMVFMASVTKNGADQQTLTLYRYVLP
jgi:photosystem II stability/assembly factor-like uncharacterized protein